MNKVWSVTINGQNDCVVMSDEEAALVTLKFAPNIDIHDMTTKHGMTPEFMQTLTRNNQLEVKGTLLEKYAEAGIFGAFVKQNWTFKDLLEMETT